MPAENTSAGTVSGLVQCTFRTQLCFSVRISFICLRASASCSGILRQVGRATGFLFGRVERAEPVVQLRVLQLGPEVLRFDGARVFERVHRLVDVEVDGVRHAQHRPHVRRLRMLEAQLLELLDVRRQILRRDVMRRRARELEEETTGRAAPDSSSCWQPRRWT